MTCFNVFLLYHFCHVNKNFRIDNVNTFMGKLKSNSLIAIPIESIQTKVRNQVCDISLSVLGGAEEEGKA